MISGIVATMAIGSGQAVKVPELSREFRAVWVATVDNIDYPSKPGLPVSAMKSEMLTILDKCKSLNINAVVFQVRPSADALYKSELEPWSWYLTGDQGSAPADGFDPLTFAIDEAHKRGIELHAWCNPYRALHPAQKGPVADNHLTRTNPGVVKQYGSYLWMDPGEKVVQKRSYDVFMDLAERYDLDGIHIDDYFYPYPVQKDGKDVDFPDSASYSKYVSGGGLLGVKDWRRKNVDDFIQQVYTGLKKVKPTVKFGISPFGIYRPGVPAGIRAGIDQYDALYADCLRWYREGWLDYYTPQLYWPISQTPQAYGTLLKYWNEQNAKGRHFWPGNYTSRTDPAGGNWKASEVVNQIGMTRKVVENSGNVHFSMKALLRNWNGISDALKSGPYAKPALIPASPWLDKEAPGLPGATLVVDGSAVTVSVTEPAASDVRFYLYQTSDGQTILTSEKSAKFERQSAMWVSIRAYDRAMNEGPVRILEISGTSGSTR